MHTLGPETRKILYLMGTFYDFLDNLISLALEEEVVGSAWQLSRRYQHPDVSMQKESSR